MQELGKTSYILVPMDHESFALKQRAQRYERTIVEELSGIFGGTTTYKVNGAYVMKDGTTAYDYLTKIEVVTPSYDRILVTEKLHEMAKTIARGLNQESVLINVLGTSYLVYKDEQ
jgi:predicted membrane-bound mannosyltransferase